MKKIICIALAIAMIGVCACAPKTPVDDTPIPSIGITEESPDAGLPADTTPDMYPMEDDQSGNEVEPLTEVDQNTQDISILLDQAPAFEITYDKSLKSSFIFITVRNKTKSTLKGGLVFHIYENDKIVATVPAEVDEEGNADNTIRSGESVSLVGEVAGRDCTYLDVDIASDPANPFKAVS